MTNKKKIILISIFFILIFMVGYKYYTRPQNFKRNISGIKYQTNNKSYQENVEIRVEGRYSRKLFRRFKFEGQIYLNNKEFSCIINNSNSSPLTYTDEGYTRTYGTIYSNTNLNPIVILVGNWSSKDGIIISGPANARKDALTETHEVMEKFLSDYGINDLE
ncbi:hypothetical protein [Sporosalibacterium faouarense]|uniref:hypothetical protein n=1 Tax=Sporosalibacterium faouarense TaxID=516123 RepID=UPI00141C9844|nr:hypothetical protein [Sporosalibacterium faouarense]MTI47930.1 hypothetical protein [Bacillota bacterium]